MIKGCHVEELKSQHICAMDVDYHAGKGKKYF